MGDLCRQISLALSIHVGAVIPGMGAWHTLVSHSEPVDPDEVLRGRKRADRTLIEVDNPEPEVVWAGFRGIVVRVILFEGWESALAVMRDRQRWIGTEWIALAEHFPCMSLAASLSMYLAICKMTLRNKAGCTFERSG